MSSTGAVDSPLTIQLHGVEGLIPELQLREDDGVVSEVGAQHPVLQHAQSYKADAPGGAQNWRQPQG